MSKALVLINAREIEILLKDKENQVIERIKQAYELHAKRETVVPYSQFLKLPNGERNRIISLPAYLGGSYKVAGVKWIASFPDNIYYDLPRASALLLLNSCANGFPKAVLEGSIISRVRTAASAVLAIDYLYGRDVRAICFVGCGPINREILKLLILKCANLTKVDLFDIQETRAISFRQHCLKTHPSLEIQIYSNIDAAINKNTLVSFATTAASPYVSSELPIPKDSLFLNISLRDLPTELILKANNVVDDIDHTLREKTSLHLTESLVGHRNFVHRTLGEIISSKSYKPSAESESRLTIFSPFGLGILDLAIGDLVYELALQSGMGLQLDSFFPTEENS